jgi:hypothetical protein
MRIFGTPKDQLTSFYLNKVVIRYCSRIRSPLIACIKEYRSTWNTFLNELKRELSNKAGSGLKMDLFMFNAHTNNPERIIPINLCAIPEFQFLNQIID